ncbi:MAG: hypothetical protein ACYC9O_00655 [Candidatus Latescibacterota bacterium]
MDGEPVEGFPPGGDDQADQVSGGETDNYADSRIDKKVQARVALNPKKRRGSTNSLYGGRGAGIL